ncbi:MAG: hypothetical protein ACFFA0_14370 [Promethearchaeota archaeon]
MIILWIGVPLLSFLLQFLPDLEGLPITSLVALIVSSVGGTLSAIMLSTSIVSERNRHVYDLFLVRSVRRSSLILSKYFAVYLCLVVTVLISLSVGLIIDSITGDITIDYLDATFESLGIGISLMSITCSIGIFFGVLVPSVVAAAILSVYAGSNLSSLIMIPTFFIEALNPLRYAVVAGIIVTCVIQTINIIIFNHRQF